MDAGQSDNAPFFVDNEVIVLTRNGLWMADGDEISHEPTRRLFAKSLLKDDQGYFLSIGRETKRIVVEDTAYFVHGISGDPNEGYDLRLSDGSVQRLVPGSLHYRPGRLSCFIKPARYEDEEEAKFLSVAYFEILRHLEEDHENYFLTIERQKVVLAGK
jgi:hypothetical protein